MTVLLLLASFVLITGGAILFTNAVEWTGRRLNLGHGAVGSLLAAVGTALPESLIPIVAVLAGAEGEEVAIGAIIGAPFMLATLAMLLIAGAALAFAARRSTGREIDADARTVRRDLGLFLPCFAAGIALGLVDSKPLHYVGAVALILAYGWYVRRTIKKEGDAEEEEPKPLYFDTSKQDPPNLVQLVGQLVAGLLMIIGGAELFVEEIQKVAESLGVAPLVLSLVLAPLATELPEKLNSVIWIRQDKDRLAVGNVVGAMAFQSTVPVAFGLAVTEWDLEPAAIAAGVLGLIGGALALWRLRAGRMGPAAVLAWSALFIALVVFAFLDSS
jgi:cation:H+ antiporter